MAEKILRLPMGDKSPEARLLYGADVRTGLRLLEPASVHCAVTSPPYFALRDYGSEPTVWGGNSACTHMWVSSRYYTENGAGKSSAANFTQAGESNAARVKESRWREEDTCSLCGAWRGHLGLEKTPSLYVAHLVEVFAEVARVLRPDGTLWLNLGDSYSGHHGNKQVADEDAPSNKPGYVENMRASNVGVEGLKAKDLMLIPFRVALAMQEAGWYLRSWAPWVKRNCLPEAITDRPSNALEVMYLFAHPKSGGRYFYDINAVRKPHLSAFSQDAILKAGGVGLTSPEGENFRKDVRHETGEGTPRTRADRAGLLNPSGRNRRNTDWFFESIEAIQNGEDEVLTDEDGSPLAHVVNPRPYQGSHFAVMPPAIVEPCIKASTSEHGVCSQCGNPWKRLTEKSSTTGKTREEMGQKHRRESLGLNPVKREGAALIDVVYTTVGWEPSCTCTASIAPATVLDPFSGSGTVGMVALQHGRAYVGTDLNESYLPLAEARICGTAPPDLSSMGSRAVEGSTLDLFGE